jgi:hypothetical protein
MRRRAVSTPAFGVTSSRGNNGVIVGRVGDVDSTWATSIALGLCRVIGLPVLCLLRAYVWLAIYARLLASLRRTGRTFVTARYVCAGRLNDGATIVVFAHYDPAGSVHDFVIYYLRSLRDAGYAVVFVCNCPNLGMASLQRVLPVSALVLLRENIGYNFGAFKDGIEALGELSRFEQVVLANDSVYGPLFDLRETLARCDASADIWGMTDNWAGGYHLQSYFLLFRGRALAFPDLKAFFRSVRPVQSKEWVIRRYEIGLTQAMQRAGLRCTALFPYEVAVALFTETVQTDVMQRPGLSAQHRRYFSVMLRRLERGTPLNATHCFWNELVGKIRCPFIKRELLIDNPVGVRDVPGWREMIRCVSTYETELAERHMRTFRHRPGRVGPGHVGDTIQGHPQQAGGDDLRKAVP